jgi:multidrug efflux pump subunit AcrA (membrane-fusion protein)
MATSTGTVTLRADLRQRRRGAVFPNEFVNVKLLVDTLQNAVLVPTPAVQSGAPGDYVYLVNADQTGLRAQGDAGARATARTRSSCRASRRADGGHRRHGPLERRRQDQDRRGEVGKP